MTRLEKFQKVLELYEAFRKANGITGYYNNQPYWEDGYTEGWVMSERMTELTSKGNCEKVDCGDLIYNLNNIPGVAAETAYAYDQTYGFKYTITE